MPGIISTLKPAEAELLNNILKNAGPTFKGAVDWNAVTQDSHYKSRKVTMTMVGALCQKYKWLQSNNGTRDAQAGDNAANEAVPKKSPSKKQKRKHNDSEDEA